MTLTLSVLRCPDAVPPETKRINGGEFRIGRGQDNEWIMPDPERMLSKRHCVIAFRNGGWAIADTSTNGTFLNRDAEPLGTGQVRALTDGDRIRMGAYEIEVRIAEEQSYAPAPQGSAFGGTKASPFDDPFGDDVFAAKPVQAETFSSGAFGGDALFGGVAPQQSITMPGRFDPLAPQMDDEFLSAPTQADHTPSFSDAFKPPAVTSTMIPDDDWDLGFAPAAPAAPPQAFTPQPLPPQPVAPPYNAPPPVAAPEPFPQAFAPQPSPQPAEPSPAAFAPQPLATPQASSPFDDDPFAPAAPVRPQVAAPVQAQPVPVQPLPVQPVQAPPSQAAAYAPQGATPDIVAAFMEGAGIAGKPDDAAALMRAMGAAMRATVSGIRQALIARASIKGEFRIEQTMIRSRGNNPLKFSADDDDALSALMGVGRRMDVKADAAIADALRDMRLHELATMAAMQDAVRALMTQLAPAKLRAEAESGGMTVLPAQKKARAFEAYEKLHDNVTRALADDFDSVFGKSFARAYETALRDISAKDPQ